MSNSGVSTEELDSRKRLFESELQEWEKKDDPLTAWSGYLGWLEGKGLSRHNSYKQAIQRCLKYFNTAPEFNGEMRLARIYMSAAAMCKDPVSIYKHMRGLGIGTKYAPYYKAFATTLTERGERAEAIRVLEGGVQAEARPLNLLTKSLTELKAASQLTKTVLDDKSERNAGFYQQPGIVVCYQKELVYPRSGGDVSLEQIRGVLPCYAPSFSCYAPAYGEEDMDMTEAQLGHITEHVPIFKHHLQSVVPPRPQLVGLLSDRPPTDPPSSNRKRVPSDEDIEQQLEELVWDREMTKGGHTSTMGDSHAPKISGDVFERELFANVSNVVSQGDLSTSQPPSPPQEMVADKENVVRASTKKTPYDFTPGCASGVSIPQAESDVHELVGRLNFSEAELSIHQSSIHQRSVHQRSIHQRSAHTVDLFNTSLECEKRAKLTNEQERFENEFANTGHGPAHQHPSLINESSFGMFHDSWANKSGVGFSKSAISRPEPQKSSVSGVMSKSALSRVDTGITKRVDTGITKRVDTGITKRVDTGITKRVDTGITKRVDTGITKRVPLQVRVPVVRRPLQLLSMTADTSHSDDYSINSYGKLPPGVDSHVSYQPSLMADSFSVCEDTKHDQSSFAPYHDSWAKPPQQQQPSHNNMADGRSVYHVPVGVPLMRGQGGDGMNHTIDQSFTQFDIPRPKGSLPYSAASTPAGQRVTSSVMPLNMDLSVIPSHDPPATIEPLLPNKPPPPSQGGVSTVVPAAGNADLSTITEESENYRSSQSSSKFTVSSGSSRFSTSSASSQGISTLVTEGVDPFQPAIVNMMLNKAGGSEHLTVIEGESPDVMSGCVLMLEGVEYVCVGVDSETGTTKHCTLRQGNLALKTLKVSSECLDWEVSVLELLGTRLTSHSLQGAVSSFVQVEAALRFRHSSFIITQHYPYGSIQDFTSSTASDCLSLYLTCELVTAVAALHQCKILHTAIAPHNVMIRDVRMFQDVRSALGHGVCLVDFSAAVDLSCFPDDVTFVGSGRTECPQMKEGKPWKWQVDYFGLAGIIHTLLTGTGLVVCRDNGVYRLDHPLPRRHRGVLGQLLDVLVNAMDCLPLMELVQPIQAQLLTMHSRSFGREVKQCYKS